MLCRELEHLRRIGAATYRRSHVGVAGLAAIDLGLSALESDLKNGSYRFGPGGKSGGKVHSRCWLLSSVALSLSELVSLAESNPSAHRRVGACSKRTPFGAFLAIDALDIVAQRHRLEPRSSTARSRCIRTAQDRAAPSAA